MKYYLDVLLLLCSDSRNDVPPVPQRNVSIAAERGAVRPSTSRCVYDVSIMYFASRGDGYHVIFELFVVIL